MVGVRESRKLRGVHILTGDELKACTDFEDSIALGNYDIDIHNPEGTGTYIYHFKEGDYFRIPYRSLLPKETDNLLVAGRSICGSSEAAASYRVMPACVATGQAAGTAAAMAVAENVKPEDICIKKLQNTLIEQGSVIKRN